MIQCPNCFSWINDASSVCPCCDCDIYPPKENFEKDEPTSPSIYGIKPLVWGMILNVIAAQFALNCVIYFTMMLTGADYPMDHEVCMFLVPFFGIMGVNVGIVGTVLCRVSKRIGNPSKLVRIATTMGVVSLVSMLLLIVGAMIYIFVIFS